MYAGIAAETIAHAIEQQPPILMANTVVMRISGRVQKTCIIASVSLRTNERARHTERCCVHHYITINVDMPRAHSAHTPTKTTRHEKRLHTHQPNNNNACIDMRNVRERYGIASVNQSVFCSSVCIGD